MIGAGFSAAGVDDGGFLSGAAVISKVVIGVVLAFERSVALVRIGNGGAIGIGGDGIIGIGDGGSFGIGGEGTIGIGDEGCFGIGDGGYAALAEDRRLRAWPLAGRGYSRTTP